MIYQIIILIMFIGEISDYVSNIDYKKHVNILHNKFSNPKIKNLLILTLLNLCPSAVNNPNTLDKIYNTAASNLDDKSRKQDNKVPMQTTIYDYDTISDFDYIDVSQITPEEFFTDKVSLLEDNSNTFYRSYNYDDIVSQMKRIVPQKYHYFFDKCPNKIRADLLMWYIDQSYKDNFDQLKDIYDTLNVDNAYRYPIFQKLNIIFDNSIGKHLYSGITKDIHLYDKNFYHLLYDKITQDKNFYIQVHDYIDKYQQTYHHLSHRTSTKKHFAFNDSSEVEDYDIKFGDKYYILPKRLDYNEAKKKLDSIGVGIYSSAEFDQAIWNKFNYYTTSIHGLSSLVPDFLDYLQQDLSSIFPDIGIWWDENKLIVRGWTEYSHSDYFISVGKKTISPKNRWSDPKVNVFRKKNYLFDYNQWKLADIKDVYKVDNNTIKWNYIDKIITKHQFWYSIDVQSRWLLWIALSMYTDVWSTSYNFKNKNKVWIKQYWPDRHITALFTYHDNHFHILVLPSDLYEILKHKL